MARPRKIYNPEIHLPPIFILDEYDFYRNHINTFSVETENLYSTISWIVDDNSNYVGARLTCELSGFGTFAFHIQQEIHFNGFIENYSQIISDGSVDTSRLDVNEETLQAIVMRLPEPEY